MPIVSVRDDENNTWKINVLKKWQKITKGWCKLWWKVES